MDFGAFVELEPGIEGLVHISELSHKRIWRCSDVVKEGQEIEVMVLSVDTEAQRMSLSMKDAFRPARAGQEGRRRGGSHRGQIEEAPEAHRPADRRPRPQDGRPVWIEMVIREPRPVVAPRGCLCLPTGDCVDLRLPTPLCFSDPSILRKGLTCRVLHRPFIRRLRLRRTASWEVLTGERVREMCLFRVRTVLWGGVVQNCLFLGGGCAVMRGKIDREEHHGDAENTEKTRR